MERFLSDPQAQAGTYMSRRGQGQGQHRRSKRRKQQERRFFDLDCQSCTSQMYLEDLEHLGGSDDDVNSLHAPFLLFPLHSAADHERADIVLSMLAQGYDKDLPNGEGLTPLQVAAVQALLDAGADVNLRCRGDWSVLDRAVGYGHQDIVRVIIESGMDVNAVGRTGNISLHHSVFSGRAEMVPLLCLKGATIDALNHEGESPLLVAAMVRDLAVVRAVLAAGADVSHRCHRGMSALNWATQE